MSLENRQKVLAASVYILVSSIQILTWIFTKAAWKFKFRGFALQKIFLSGEGNYPHFGFLNASLDLPPIVFERLLFPCAKYNAGFVRKRLETERTKTAMIGKRDRKQWKNFVEDFAVKARSIDKVSDRQVFRISNVSFEFGISDWRHVYRSF